MTDARPRRRRWVGVLIGLVLLAALLAVGLFVADALAKAYAADYVRQRVVTVLKLDSAAGVDVDLGPGSVLLQFARGALDEVKVDVDTITFGGISGRAQLTATAVPLDTSKPVDRLGIRLTVDEDNVRKLADHLSGLELATIDLQDERIRIGTDLTFLFLTVPVAVDLDPVAQDGGIAFDPATIILGDQRISVDDLRANPQFGGLAGDLLASREFCVAEFLPEALTVDSVRVVGTDLVVGIEGDGTALADPALSTLGTCP